MSFANRSLYLFGVMTAFYLAGRSLYASTSQANDNPLDLIEASFFHGPPPTSSTTLTNSIPPPLPVDMPPVVMGQTESDLNRTTPRRIQASLTNWQNNSFGFVPTQVSSYQEIIPEPVIVPFQPLGTESFEPSPTIESVPFSEDLPAEDFPSEDWSTIVATDPYDAYQKKQVRPSELLIGRRPFRKFLKRRTQADYGLAYERIAYSPMVLDTPLTSPYVGFRIRSDRGMNAPDRLEYLWGKAGSGPSPESRVDLLDTIFRTELGNEKAGFISEMRMRSLDPNVNGNTVGFGDMLVGGKVLVYDSASTKVSTIFLTHLNTGPEKKGLGRGHVALEPGVLAMRKWNERTYLFGEWKYHVPLGATPGFAGDVFRTGWGVATIWHDSDRYAMIPTFEIQTHSFLFGGRTLPDGTEVRVDGTTAVDLLPGIRWSFSETSLGACELGVSGGVSIADHEWFDSRVMLELRWLR